ncbi:MAG: response regulator [Candidatus Omnitrophica bacterium]|jgi:DNA-binding response OmpR family regulator|nr:response regulator [Candidatus Omnitrophota bacterium]
MAEKKVNGIKILVIDDDAQICELVKEGLSQWGYKVLTAKAGNIGIWIADCKWHKPDLIILDLMMQGIDGFEVLRRLREDKLTAYMPVIIMTGKTDYASQLKAEGLYCDDYIVKPVSLEVLRSRIEQVLKKRGII